MHRWWRVCIGGGECVVVAAPGAASPHWAHGERPQCTVNRP
ncbi:hypothetical protein I546_2949 [Mycobacterium kansasii 732]|nr:hypothetical protein I546_2949 [Mycobacterium kansasii 732]